MAETEDTELRDLMIEALEKNGSLAKIKANLRANIFLAFENEREVKYNEKLDDVRSTSDGLIALSVINEFLSFCDLRNTLFVYKAESSEGNLYEAQSRKNLLKHLNFTDSGNYPILVLLIKLLKTLRKSANDGNVTTDYSKGDFDVGTKTNIRKEDDNCTYIVHDDTASSGASATPSENSIDEKNRLLLQLNLENSDTDTSSDSKTCSEYVPSEHLHIYNQSEKNVNGELEKNNSIDHFSQFATSNSFLNLNEFNDDHTIEEKIGNDNVTSNSSEKFDNEHINSRDRIDSTKNSSTTNSDDAAKQNYSDSKGVAEATGRSCKSKSESTILTEMEKFNEYSNDFTSKISTRKDFYTDKEKYSLSSASLDDIGDIINENHSSKSNQSDKSSVKSISVSVIKENSNYTNMKVNQEMNSPTKVSNNKESDNETSCSSIPSVSNISTALNSDA